MTLALFLFFKTTVHSMSILVLAFWQTFIRMGAPQAQNCWVIGSVGVHH